jgi:AMMECR1 domain-containing protein
VLSPLKPVQNASEIVLGRDGVLVSQAARSGVFLPQVADETGWSKEEFLSQLCSQKAGLSRDCWKDLATRLETFTVESFHEGE